MTAYTGSEKAEKAESGSRSCEGSLAGPTHASTSLPDLLYSLIREHDFAPRSRALRRSLYKVKLWNEHKNINLQQNTAPQDPYLKENITISSKSLPTAPRLTVIGATGTQGSSVVDAALQATSPYQVRAITCNPSSESGKALQAKGVEVVRADLADYASLKAAFANSDVIFAMTDFFVPFAMGADA